MIKIMKSSILIILLGAFTLSLNAQVNFQKKGTITGKLNFDAYHSDQLAYSEQLENNVYVFTIYNDDFSINRTFSIPNCDQGLAILNPQAAFDVSDTHLSQGLFNDDEKFEVVRINSNNQMEVVTEDNVVIGILPDEFNCTYGASPDNEPYLYTCQLNDNDYIFADNIYLINKNANSNFALEKRTKSIISPNPVKQTEILTVDLSEIELSSNSYIEIVNMSGIVVEHFSISDNVRNIQVPVQSLSPGQYVYAITSNETTIETGKLTIK